MCRRVTPYGLPFHPFQFRGAASGQCSPVSWKGPPRPAQELFLLASRVGIPKEILTDQGTPLYVLANGRPVPVAGVKQLRPPPASPPLSSCSFRQPRGLLDVAKEGWEQQPAPHQNRSRACETDEGQGRPGHAISAEHLTKAQQPANANTTGAAQPREFQPGGGRLRSWSPQRPKWVGTRDQLAALAISDPVVVDTNPELAAGQKTELQHLVGQFSDVFSTRPRQTNVIEHEIRTPPGVVVRQRPYRVPEARRTAIESEIQDMLKLGVIEPSRSPWSSPIVMVPKPDGTLRFCNDFRRLHEVSEFDGYPMPRGDELLERLGRARYISTLDLTKGYWQVRLTESSKVFHAEML
ncbi:hypothetical protein QQF64_023914 [Cirrhinus molitorella]|uniref:Uncharacterized protein n=1 Tax=Cirrhinus molitorella TaxID=172907 RepID=A0ABR3NJR8_9TELE